MEPLSLDNLIGSKLEFKALGSDEIIARGICEFSTGTNNARGQRLNLFIDANSLTGKVDEIGTPTTVLKRDLRYYGSVSTIKADMTAVTVDSTLGFPESGMIFVGTEGITYTIVRQPVPWLFPCLLWDVVVSSPQTLLSMVATMWTQPLLTAQ